MHTREHILPLLHDALRAIGAPAGCPILLDVPRRSESRGDLSTGIALALARSMGGSPRRIAEAIVAAIPADDPAIASVEIAGPGFINITFTPEFHALHLRRALALGERYGRVERASPRRVVVEQRATPGSGDDDPTPIRGAILADAIAALLTWRGDEVELRLDPRLSSTESALRPIIEALGVQENRWENRDGNREAVLNVLVVDGRHGAQGSERLGGEGDRCRMVRHGGVSLEGIERDNVRYEGLTAMRTLLDETGPAPLRLHLLSGSPGAVIRLDDAAVTRHSAANPLYAPHYTLFAIDALLRAATAIAPFDLPALPIDLPTPASLKLARHLLFFPDVVERGAGTLDPSLLAGYLTGTAALAWPLITGHPLVTASGALDTARLPLLAAAAMVIRNGLGGR